MSAYIIVEVEVTAAEPYEVYKQLTPATLLPFGGKFIVRGGETKTLEGGWEPKRIVVLQFPTAELATAWWHSEEYKEAKVIRQASATTKMILVNGVD